VADVDDVDALLPAAVVDREEMPAGEREELGDPGGLQAPGDQPAAVDRLALSRRRGLCLGRHAAASLSQKA
jgi:hypothetical protein